MMATSPPGGYSVLITDDDPTCRDTLRCGLEPQGYETHVASCGLEAVRIVKRMRIHVVFVDMYMPDMTGVETVEMILQTVKEPPPCILMMSGAVTKELMMRALHAHAHTLLPKPLDLGLIRTVLDGLIRRTYLRRG